MISNNINIDNTILIKILCKNIITDFNNNDNNKLQEFINNHINSLNSDYKKNFMMNILIIVLIKTY